ncbi:TMEM43 family protein [bacterium]|nr:TMEM43 family protein [bacterium]
MSNSFTEVTNESWFGRIKGAFKGIIVGVIFIFIAFPLLFINEGRAVKRYKTLKEGGGIVISVAADSVDPGNGSKLIHLTGRADTDEILEDSAFGVSQNALKLKRTVEMFQWKEKSQTKTKKKMGGGQTKTKTYSYSKIWSSNVIRSANFKDQGGHKNPGSFPYSSAEMVADNVTLGAFTLSPSLVGKIQNYSTLGVGTDTVIPETLGADTKLHDGGFYIGANPAAPVIGDLRITFKIANPTKVSVVAAQVAQTFEPYNTETGGSIELLQIGTHSAESMIQKAQDDNKMLSWILRAVGFILFFAGFKLLLGVFSVLADVVPFFGNIVGVGTGIISFLLAAILSIGTIGIAWVTYRPLLGVPLLLAVVALIVVVIRKMKAAPKPVTA